MTKKKISCLGMALLIGLLINSPTLAQWKTVKQFIQKDVTILKETKLKLVLYHEALSDSLVLGESKKTTCDIYGSFQQKRGGNPYRIWTATTKLWNDPRRPKRVWGKFFRAQFLKVVRPPEKTDTKLVSGP